MRLSQFIALVVLVFAVLFLAAGGGPLTSKGGEMPGESARPYSADRPPETCALTIAAAAQAAIHNGGRINAVVDVDGQVVDQLLVAELDGVIGVWGARAGCMVGYPLGLFEMRRKPPGTPA